jgi:hypothetical protein
MPNTYKNNGNIHDYWERVTGGNGDAPNQPRVIRSGFMALKRPCLCPIHFTLVCKHSQT